MGREGELRRITVDSYMQLRGIGTSEGLTKRGNSNKGITVTRLAWILSHWMRSIPGFVWLLTGSICTLMRFPSYKLRLTESGPTPKRFFVSGQAIVREGWYKEMAIRMRFTACTKK